MMSFLKWPVSLLLAFFLIFPAIAAGRHLMMATTTSTDNTGLLDELALKFKQDKAIELRWTAVGTGKALELGRNCDVDVLIVHAPAAEEEFIKNGHGVERRRIMHNDFVIIGPGRDPAGIQALPLKLALRRIFDKNAVFVSRGDDSGTNKKERSLWKMAGITMPVRGKWYLETGQGMISTLRIAAEREGYTLTDRGTYIKYANNHDGDPPLKILVQGDPAMRNPYSVIAVNPQRCENVASGLAREFINWLTSPQTQDFIGNYKLLGKQLFTPDAGE